MGEHVAEQTEHARNLEGGAMSEAMWENVQRGHGKHADYMPVDSGWDERIGVTE